MGAYVSKSEEFDVRALLDELAPSLGYISDRKEAFLNGFYLDRLWYSRLGTERIPAVGFEIERSVPLNERLRKDIMNVVWSRAPLGFILIPHRRILADPRIEKGSTEQNWYANTFRKTFEEYRRPFSFYCEIRVADLDALLEQHSLLDATL